METKFLPGQWQVVGVKSTALSAAQFELLTLAGAVPREAYPMIKDEIAVRESIRAALWKSGIRP